MKITPLTYLINKPMILRSNIMPQNEHFAAMQAQRKQITQLSSICYRPVSFSSERTFKSDTPKLKERSGDFAICKFNNLTCPACGKKMMTRAKFEKFADELASVEQDQYLSFLANYYDYMRPVEASVYKEICQEAQKSGSSTDLRELLVSLRDSKLPVLQEVQMRQINKMTSLAKSLPDDEKSVLLAKIQKLKAQIKKKNAQAPFRRKIMIDRISKVKISNPRKYEKLQMIAKNFPTSSDMNSAWIVKYSGKNKYNEDWDSYSIALRFLESSVANTDHILAYDIDNNHDDISNYMAMHSACNSQKGNKPFLQWLHEDKYNRIQYMRQYFDEVQELINSRKLTKKKYRHYVAYATGTIEEVSRGQVKLI